MSIRVLVVDDHVDARAALARRLSRAGQLDIVGTVSGLEEAAAIMPDARPDIVLMDIHPRDERAPESCKALRAMTDAPVVVFTSFITPALWQQAQAAGAADYLLKHVDSDRLSRQIVRLAERFRSTSSRAASEPA